MVLPTAAPGGDHRLSVYLVFSPPLCQGDILRHGGSIVRDRNLWLKGLPEARMAVSGLSLCLGALLLGPTKFLGGSDPGPAFRGNNPFSTNSSWLGCS